MRIVHEILQELWPDVPAVDCVADLLVQGGVEVESQTKIVWPISQGQVVLGRIETIMPHPDADKLQVTTVNIGQSERLTIVCGAKNIAASQLVPVVLPGTVLPSGLEIAERNIRGVHSMGMLASAEELGLGKAEDVIFLLSGVDRPLGTNVAELWPETTVFETSITPNRGDLLSHWGVVRDLKLVSGLPATAYPNELFGNLTLSEAKPGAWQIDIQDSQACSRFSLTEFQLPASSETPFWLKRQLMLTGSTLYTLPVDVTNYLTQLIGQPGHVYDADKIKGDTITTRMTSDESVMLLDKSSYKLHNNLVVADQVGAIALAGVMGDERTAVDGQTTHILFEAAHWNPKIVRRDRRSHGLSTEASYRFERFVDPELPELAAILATRILQQLGGKLLSHRVAGQTAQSVAFSYDPTLTDALIGEPVASERQQAILLASGCHVAAGETWQITPPSWRPDLTMQAEVTEEIARVVGLAELKPEPVVLPVRPMVLPPELLKIEALRDFLKTHGLTEIYSSPFVPIQDLQLFDETTDGLLKVTNPASPEMTWVRPTLQYGTIEALRRNQFEAETLWLFEIGHVAKAGQGQWTEGVSEDIWLSIGGFTDQPIELVQLMKELFTWAKMTNAVVTEVAPEANQIGQLTIMHAARQIGKLIVPSQTWLKRAKLKRPLCWVNLSLEAITAAAPTPPLQTPDSLAAYQPFSRFPKIVRDVTFVVPQAKAKHFEEACRPVLANLPLLSGFELRDTYQANDGKANMTLRLTFRAADRSLTDTEVNSELAQVIQQIEQLTVATWLDRKE